jgi:hypothetical protein
MPPFNLIGMPQQLPLGSVSPYATGPTQGPGFNMQASAPSQGQATPGLIGQTINNAAQSNQQNFLKGDLNQVFGSTGQGTGAMGTILGLFGL